MLSTLIWKDIRIMRRSNIYSVFEIVIVMLLFTGIGFISFKYAMGFDGVGSRFEEHDDFEWRKTCYYSNCPPSRFVEEPTEETIRNLTNTMSNKNANLLSIRRLKYDGDSNNSLYVGIADNNQTLEYNITLTLDAYEYVTYKWTKGRPRRIMNEEMFEGMIHFLTSKIEPIDMLKNTTPRIYNMPETKQGTISKTMLRIMQNFIILVVINITRNIVYEKATFREYLVSMGLPLSTYYLAHFLFNLAKCLIIFTPGVCFFALTQKSIVAGVYLSVSFLLYLLPTISFAFMIASFFKTGKAAILTCLVTWLTLVSLPYFLIGDDMEKLLDYRIGFVACLIFTFNMHYIGETLGTMSEFDNFSMFTTSERILPLWALWIALLINALIMFAMAVLVDELGERLSLIRLWHKVFHKKNEQQHLDTTMTHTATQTVTQTGSPSIGRTNRSKCGSEPITQKNEEAAPGAAQNKNVGKSFESDIDIHDVVKIYSTGEMAVKGLTMRAIRGKVSVLVGHNGCGKSTTFAMISAMTQPTEGTVKVCGLDVVAHRSEARKKIGLCPQYNPLIDKLTVWEHLKIVHTLKKAETPFEEDAEKLLEAISLLDKKDELSKNLSGGMKRKLCMCMALIGDSRVVLLDEPTAGMDVGARLDVQKMLRSIKKDRTILLTTHNMDEADKLADWVYVMSEGRIQASGSSQFLKSKFGGGWLITVVTEDAEKDAPILLKVCKKFVHESTIKDTRGQMIEFNVPSDDKTQVIQIVKCLETISEKDFDGDLVKNLSNIEQVKNVHIFSVGVSLNSLEQVFISVIEQCEKEANRNRTNEQKSETLRTILEKKEEAPAFGPWSQFIGLSFKRLIYIRRNLILHFLNLLIPIGLLILAIHTGLDEMYDGLQTTHVDVNLIPSGSIVVIQSDSDATAIESFFKKNPNLIIRKFGANRGLRDIVNKEQFFRRISVVVKVENQVATGVWINTKMMKAGAIGAFLKFKLHQGLLAEGYKITINWVLFSEDLKNIYSNLDILIIILFTFLVTYSISTCAYLHAEERVSKFKHQQFLTEMSPFIYWFSMYFWEFLIFAVTLAGIVGALVLFGIVWDQTAIEFFLISCLGWIATAPIVFIASFIVDSPTKLDIIVIIFCLFIPLIKMIVDFIMYSKSLPFLQNIRFIFPFQPFFTLIFWSYFNLYPEEAPEAVQVIVASCFPGGKDINIYYFETISLAVSAILYNFLLVLISSKFVQSTINGWIHSRHLAEPRIPLNMEPCQAVEKEEKDVIEGRLTAENCTVLVNEMVKRYGSYQAVNGVFLGVKPGECFGLLGVNGAGKSTMIEILTGKQFACSGEATISEISVEKLVRVGYCPQFDAVLSEFTGRDVLKILARLHNYQNPSELVNELIDCIGMTGNADKQIRYCSGGQKRKISMGMGILSRSSAHSGGLIILDEPTAGVDPKARRDLWDIVVGMRSGKQQHGASTGIMLTSHSMEECEALCTRIGILRKGEMIALGSHQDLKSKYGNTFTLTIVMKNEKENEKENERKEIIEKIRQTFGEKTILLTDEDDHTNNLVWEIPREKGEKWSTKMDEVKKVAEELNIENYFLVQSSLEDTFIKMNSANIEMKSA